MDVDFHVVIPARYQSSRFPGKVLADIAGKPMIQHVYEQALQSGAIDVIIATDDPRIQKAAENFGATVCMTGAQHQSGTDRVAEVVTTLSYMDEAIVVAVQGDEPLINPTTIAQAATDLYDHSEAQIATLCESIETTEQLLTPNIVKVVFDQNNLALYFSRAPIPWDRDTFPLEHESILSPDTYFRHIGIYSYRVGYLKQFVSYEPCDLELMEKLEQLRALWYGAKIYVGISQAPAAVGVDTPEDLEKVRALLEQ